MSQAAAREAYRSETGEAWLTLLTIEHPTLAEPIRVTTNYENVTSRGNVFLSLPFTITWPKQRGVDAYTATLRIDNVDRSLVRTLRSIEEPPSVTMEVVTASTPDTLEMRYTGFFLSNGQYNRTTVQGNLEIRSFASEPFPSITYTPGRFPGLFR